ncbi:hypothetical protein CFP56_042253 [Quercus suber]|uniref:Uncharacterized protein n=1 Tax=Quercus suber TaxID=58331 RepID=A0AAW0LIP2_QUESU
MLKRFDLQGVRRHVQVSYKRMHEIFDDIIATRLKHRETDKTTRHGDFLDVLLDQMQEDGSDFSIDTIKPLILMKTIISLILAENRTPGIVNNFKEIWNTFNCGMSGTCQTMPPKETLISLGKAGKLSITYGNSVNGWLGSSASLGCGLWCGWIIGINFGDDLGAEMMKLSSTMVGFNAETVRGWFR